MITEFLNCEEKKAWVIVPKSKVPKGRKIIGNRWVYAEKDDGTFRSRTVAKGFSQVPGKDFQEHHSPVVNDTTTRVVLVQKLIYNLHSRQFDIVTAFLYGLLDEEIYMEFPEGYEKFLKEHHGKNISSKTHCVLLLRALYGLVQAARQWYKKITSIFGKLDFHPSPADPCLYIKKAKENEPPAYIILYVDDGVIFGTPKIIEQVMKSISSVLKVKDLGEVKNFVGCRLIHSTDGKTIHIFQPKLIKNLQDSFSQYINTNRKFQTPGAPKTVVMRPEKGDNVLSPKDQTKYRSGVGMLLYLVKHSRPDISNAVRELTKVLDGATNAHWKSLIRTIKFVLDTRLYALRLSPFTRNGSLFLHGYSDSEFAGDRETRKSVYGFITFLCGAPISWKSKACHSVTLSSTEAEYYAGSETAKEMMFIESILETLGEGNKLHLPMLLRMDNTGAIYLSNNQAVGSRTKHIDIRTHYVRNLINEEIIKTLFVKSEDNAADIFTKNVTEFLFIKHTSSYMNHLADEKHHTYIMIDEEKEDEVDDHPIVF